MTRPWTDKPIEDCGEPLQALPLAIHRLNPHPYLALGAPYADGSSPWRLRLTVVSHLLNAQKELQFDFPDLCLLVFDAWRPIEVQSFMIEYSINKECSLRGLDRQNQMNQSSIEEVIKDVSKFWAPPNVSPLNPPPHSTGAAVDLTLADLNGSPIEMGGEIDQIGDISLPNYYSSYGKGSINSKASLWHSRRKILARVMEKAGFCQHPNEWWHFSYGDQLWAWKKNILLASYGRIDY